MPAINTIKQKHIFHLPARLWWPPVLRSCCCRRVCRDRPAGSMYRVQEPGSDAQLVQGGHHSDDEMQKCIQLCRASPTPMCTQTIAHCLKLGGGYVTPDHIRLMVDCAQMCATSADFMLRESPFHDRICRLCSELCKQCGKDCEQAAGDDQMVKQCAEMCRRCAGSCERMASKAAA